MINSRTRKRIHAVINNILSGHAACQINPYNAYKLLPVLALILVSACQQTMKQVEIQAPEAAAKKTPSAEISESTAVSSPTVPEDTIDTSKAAEKRSQTATTNTSNTLQKHSLTTRDTKTNPLSPSPAAKPLPKVIKQQPVAVRGRKSLPGQNKFYDRKNSEYKTLQKANHALAGFPVDTEGQVNWVLSLERGKIKPRSSVRGNRPMETLESEIIMKNTREMAHVRFPHKAHTEWLACKNCHDKIFIPEAGANNIDMTKIFQGEYCGTCHDKVAFSSFVCERCHSIPITAEQ